MTTEVGTDGATTLSRMNLSGYVGHATIFLVQCSLLRAV